MWAPWHILKTVPGSALCTRVDNVRSKTYKSIDGLSDETKCLKGRYIDSTGSSYIDSNLSSVTKCANNTSVTLSRYLAAFVTFPSHARAVHTFVCATPDYLIIHP